jgi:hypothetical protein
MDTTNDEKMICETPTEETLIEMRNKRINFIETTHTYIVDGDSSYTSVTTYLKRFFPQFNAQLAINKMKKSGSFARRFKGRTDQSVIDEWSNSGRSAAELGTKLHTCIENTYNGIKTPMDVLSEVGKEYELFKQFHYDTKDTLKPFAFEWRVFNEDLKIAGAIDAVFIDNGRYCIYDWKRTKELKTCNQYERALNPISHLDSSNFNQYAMQLNLYKYLIESKYNLFIDELVLVIMTPGARNYSLVKLPFLKSEIQAILSSPDVSQEEDKEEEEIEYVKEEESLLFPRVCE